MGNSSTKSPMQRGSHGAKALILLTSTIVLVAAYAFSGSINAQASPDKTSECWEVLQENTTMGPTKIYLAPAGARIEFPNMQVTVVCKPPTWRVSVFNQASKQEFTSSIQRWAQIGLPMENPEALPNEKGTRTPSHYAGLKAVLFKYRAHYFQKDAHNRVASTVTAGNLWAASDVSIPEQEATLLRGLLRISRVESIPLALIMDSTAGPLPVFKTTSVKKTKIPLSALSYPTAYKQVSSGTALTIGYLRTKMDFIQEFAGDMSGATSDREEAVKKH
jgi:hypothetical protein